MGWSFTEISMEELVNLIKGFVDILILASGYQSSGFPARWDPQNVKKAIQWGIFFENVFRHLNVSEGYQASVEELDAALSEITSGPYFPQGLRDLSSATLSNAREFVLRHIIHTLPLKDEHLSALLTAAVEMDLDDLRETGYDCLSAYVEQLMPQNTSTAPQSSAVPDSKLRERASSNHSQFIVQELLKRQTAVSCVSSLEMGLNILSKSITCEFPEKSQDDTSLMSEECLIEFAAWNKLRSRSLSYLLDKRTVRLISGANLIFSAPKVQWVRVFERLKDSIEANTNDTLETILRELLMCKLQQELCLLGCASNRWTSLIGHFLSVSYNIFPISKQYDEVMRLPQGRFQFAHSEKETGILDFLTVLLANQVHLLWKLSPVLAAMALPSWSHLFRLYLSEIETQFKGDQSPNRCCSCIHNGKEHKYCELAERIWCLYIFHVQGYHLMEETLSS